MARNTGLWASGDIAGVIDASKKAKMWCSIAVGLGVAVIVIWVLLVILSSAFSQR